ncbi:MAG: NAD-dependent epimerase/dehydratase family protein [Salinirussus sp.]
MDIADRHALVTGGAGFVGSHLAEGLLSAGAAVTVLDDLSAGRRDWVPDGAAFIEADVNDTDTVEAAVSEADFVCHLAAGKAVDAADPRSQFEANIAGTYTILEAMAAANVHHLLYTSSSTVYGEAPRPTPEDHGPLEPISAYGAGKLAEEGLVSTYAHSHGITARVVRFANVVGPRLRGAVVPDFIQKLRADPTELEILGDGRQQKSYLHVTDCVDAMVQILREVETAYAVYNLGTESTTAVTEIADTVAAAMNVDPAYRFTGGERGWTGDVPRMRLDISKLRALGWTPALESDAAIERAAHELIDELTEG